MPPKKPEPVKKQTKKDPKKKDDKKEEELIEPVREVRYEERAENVKSELVHFKRLVGEKRGLDVAGIVELVVEGMVREKEERKEGERKEGVEGEVDEKERGGEMGRLIKKKKLTSEQISEIFTSIKQGKTPSLQLSTNPPIQSTLTLQLSKLPHITALPPHPPLSKFPHYTFLSPSLLYHQFHLLQFETLLNSQQKYRTYSFLSRNITQTLSPSTFCQTLNSMLLNNCQYQRARVINGEETEELVALYYENPPGRNMYWTESVGLKKEGRFGYWEEEMAGKGGVATRVRWMYPGDNAMLVEKTRKVGEDVRKEIKVVRNGIELQVRKREKGGKGGEFWGDIRNTKVKMIKAPKHEQPPTPPEDPVIQQKVEQLPPVKQPPKASPKKPEPKKVDPKSLKKGEKQKAPPVSQPEPEPVPVTTEIEPPAPPPPIQYNKQSLSLQSSQFHYNISSYITVHPKSPQSHVSSVETHRQYGPHGEVIRHYKDKSISILFPNTNISTYKSGTWSKIISNTLHTQPSPSSSSQPLKTKTIPSSPSSPTITIRQDSTITLQQKSQRTIIFPDQTEYKINTNNTTITITHSSYPTIRIRYDEHRLKANTVIGQGTSYAYLGEENLFERSYDGHIVEVFEKEFSYFRYSEKVVQENELEEPKVSEVQLVYFREGSILKIEEKETLFLSSHDIKKLSEISSNEPWLQLFTTPETRKQGIYSIDLANLTIQTKDNEGNYFSLNLLSPSVIQTAVSLNINSTPEEGLGYGPGTEGYYVEKENYFLPTPGNYLPPRLFVLRIEGEKVSDVREYLDEEMFQEEMEMSVKYQHHVMRESIGYNEGREYIQIYNRREGEGRFESIVPKHSIKLDEGRTVLPKVLRDYTETYVEMRRGEVPEFEARSFVREGRLEGYGEYEEMKARYEREEQAREERREKKYKVLTREDLV